MASTSRLIAPHGQLIVPSGRVLNGAGCCYQQLYRCFDSSASNFYIRPADIPASGFIAYNNNCYFPNATKIYCLPVGGVALAAGDVTSQTSCSDTACPSSCALCTDGMPAVLHVHISGWAPPAGCSGSYNATYDSGTINGTWDVPLLALHPTCDHQLVINNFNPVNITTWTGTGCTGSSNSSPFGPNPTFIVNWNATPGSGRLSVSTSFLGGSPVNWLVAHPFATGMYVAGSCFGTWPSVGGDAANTDYGDVSGVSVSVTA
jgi:hypothetical protein